MALKTWVRTLSTSLLVMLFACTLGLGEAQSATQPKSVASRTAKPQTKAVVGSAVRGKSRRAKRSSARKIVERPSFGPGAPCCWTTSV